MTRSFRIRPLAEDDLADITLYLREQDPALALRFADALIGAIEKLLEHPEIGAPRSMPSPRLTGLRIWPVPGFERWLIFYIPTETVVHVVRVLHGARDLPTVLNQ